MKIKSQAGLMRGVRVMQDPNSILLSTFTGLDGVQYGYVVVPTEDSPAVFDGIEWHSILEDEVQDWPSFAMAAATEQFSAIQLNLSVPAYQQILTSMYGMVAA